MAFQLLAAFLVSTADPAGEAVDRALREIAAGAQPEAAAETHEELIHSDVPLWGYDSEGVWPRHFVEETSFGCAARIRYGDWRLDRSGSGDSPDWYRLSNYGVMHCFMMVGEGSQRGSVNETTPSFLVSLGTAPGRGGTVELWAIQRGGRPGSDYLLLSRRPGPGAIESFEMLQRECPPGRSRAGPSLDILSTRYCAINSQQDLIALARRMANLPPIGRLTFVGQAPEEE